MHSFYHTLAALALTVGCARAVELPENLEVDTALHNQVMDAELRVALERGIERWTAATCLDIRIDDQGVRWSLSHEPMMVETPQGEVAADGLTVPGFEAPEDVFIADYVSDVDFAVAHELGHRLGMNHNETEEPDLMSPRRTVNRALGLRWSHIGAASLEAVCSVQECKCFNPEMGPVAIGTD